MSIAGKHRSRGIALVVAGLITLVAGPAWAAGSLGLDEVMAAVKKDRKLVAEIQAELDKNNLKVEKIVCWGSRFGNHWTHLSAGRSSPYECAIGQRKITIDAEKIFFDGRGKSLGDIDKVNPAKAKSFRESKFTWEWSAADEEKKEEK
jgi:hypothetical protein